MKVEFDIKLKPEDMFRFNMYQTYTGIHGWMSIVIAILVLVVAWQTYGDVEPVYTVLYVCFGIIFLFYVPVSLKLRSKHSISVSPVLSGTLHYAVDEEGFTVSQREESAKLPWSGIYKMVATKHNVLVYSTRVNAYVIPREQLGEVYTELVKLANSKLEKYRVKMK